MKNILHLVVVYEVLIKAANVDLHPKTVGYWKSGTVLILNISWNLAKESGRYSATDSKSKVLRFRSTASHI